MKKRSALHVMALAVSLMMAVSGCSNSSSTTSDASGPPSENQKEAVVSETESGEKRVLRLWDVVVREPHPIARDLVIQKYKELNPGVEIEVTTLTGDINQKIQAAAAGKTLPDMIFTWNAGDVTTWGQMGIITPVDDIVEEFGTDWWLSTRQLEQYQIEGNTWGVPLVTFPMTFWYNKDLFDEAGLKAPSNWDEWYEAALALTKDTNGDGEIDQYGSVLGIAEGWPFSDLRGSNADYWWDAEGNLTFSERSIETLDFLRKMFDDTCYPGSVSFQNEGQRLGFLSGQGATMLTSISFLNTIIEEKGLEWLSEGHIGVASVPMNAEAKDGAGAGASTHSIGIVDGEQVDLAKDFLRYWISEEALNTYFSNNIPGHLPPYSVVWESADFKKAHDAYWDMYETGKNIVAETQWFPPTVKWEALFNADGGDSKNVMTKVTVEKKTSEEIIEELKVIAEKAKEELE